MRYRVETLTLDSSKTVRATYPPEPSGEEPTPAWARAFAVVLLAAFFSAIAAVFLSGCSATLPRAEVHEQLVVLRDDLELYRSTVAPCSTLTPAQAAKSTALGDRIELRVAAWADGTAPESSGS